MRCRGNLHVDPREEIYGRVTRGPLSFVLREAGERKPRSQLLLGFQYER